MMNPILKTALKIGAGIAINAAVGYVVMTTGGVVDPKAVVKVAKQVGEKLKLPAPKEIKG